MQKICKMPAFILVMLLLICLAVTQWLMPDREFSEMENRMLTQRPEITFDGFWSGDYTMKLELFAADQIPMRNEFVSVYATTQAALGRRMVGDALLGADGYLFDTSAEYSQRDLRMNLDALKELSAETGKNIWILPVPSAATVYPEKLPAYAPLNQEEAMLRTVEQEAEVIPLLDAMRANKDAKLLYAMDHHWTAAGARIGYEAVCDKLGLTPAPQGEILTRDGFYGSFYARYPLPWLEAEALTYELPQGVRLLINGEEKDTLVDETVLAGRDKYAALLHGNHDSMELINDSVAEGSLLVIKDSYANALLPMLARNYHQITAVDPRYFTGNIKELLTEFEGEDVLCVCGISSLGASRIIALMEGF